MNPILEHLRRLILLTLCVLLAVAACSHLARVFGAGSVSTLQGFITGVDEEGSAEVEITDGDESITVVFPAGFLPDYVKEGDPLKLEITVDEMRRSDAERRQRIRTDKREKKGDLALPPDGQVTHYSPE